MGYQKVIIQGNLGRDAELKETGGGSLCKFSVAVTERWKKDGEQKEATTWFNCSMWGRRTESLVRYLEKGKGVLVEGKIRTREYEHQGQTKKAWDLSVDNLEFVGGGRQSGATTPVPPPDPEPAQDAGLGTDDIPF